MGTSQRSGRYLWLPLVVVVVWTAASAPISVTMTTWGLSGLCAGAAIIRSTLTRRSAFAFRRRSVDVSILAVFSVVFAYLALTGHLG